MTAAWVPPPVPAEPDPAGRQATLLHQLRACVGASRRSLALEVGRLVFDEFFAGDSAAYRSQAPNKNRSLSDFAAAHQVELRALRLPLSTLRNHVSAWRSWGWLHPDVRDRLGLSSLVELRVFDDDLRRHQVNQRLLQRSADGAKEDELAAICTMAVADFRRQTARVDITAKPGRPRLPAPLKAATELQRAVTKLSMQHKAVPSLRPAERAELAERLGNVGRLVDELRRKLTEIPP